MQLPQALIKDLEGVKGFDKEAFIAVHQSEVQVTSVRLNPAKVTPENKDAFIAASQLTVAESIPWTQYGFYLQKRPSFTFDPLFHAGAYYVQEASSMFLEQALLQTADLDEDINVLDLCAAPGGKSTHLQSLLSPGSLLVSNEVIKARAGILRQNILKWGSSNVVVTNNDPQHFARLGGFFDVLVVDAPCSGSGLFRRDSEAIKEWSEEAVQLCCGRQKRIIADALPALKEGGVLIYSTCSYSPAEDEELADWLAGEMNMQNLRLQLKEEWNIVETGSPETGAFGYRFFPDKVKGEGFYLAAFKKKSAAAHTKLKGARLEKATAKEKEAVKPWLKSDDVELLKHHSLYALPIALVERYSLVKEALNVQYAGVAIGEVMKDRLVPDHALALSGMLSHTVPQTELDYHRAIRYLQKGDFNVDTTTKGWQTVSYEAHNLGWINALQNRINNYYPKELRILKQSDDAAFEK
ncbi:MAG: methyltransferase RsmF C-terminal domain-like protein [Chitinophagaceae bacterium]